MSLAEIVIKSRTGRLCVPMTVARYFSDAVDTSGIETLPLSMAHSLRLERVPLLHADPFNRLLVAQAIEERLPVVSSDAVLPEYDIDVIW